MLNWLEKAKIMSLPRKIVWKTINKIVSFKNGVVVYYNDSYRLEAISLIKKIKNEVEMLLPDNEAYEVFMAAKRTIKIDGEIAEVGVFKGGSAKLICEVKGKRKLYLFDTFNGLPALNEKDDSRQFFEGEFSASFEEVKNYLKDCEEVCFYKGVFPSTASAILDKKFSFVHLDVDIYQSARDCLEFFYPRMTKGGIILSHDFLHAKGVRKAFEEFFKDKPEVIIELGGNQCLIVKV